MKRMRIYRRFFKRPLDMMIAATALVALSPLLLVVTALVRVFLGAPVLFRQERPGLNGKTFTIYKFRTMNGKRGHDGSLLPDEQRLTGFGKFLRSTSLDELPELLNVLAGHMSIVGPRPLLVRYLPRYSPRQRRRHEVKPGLTGLAQVNGRNGISWQEKFQWDVRYVDNVTFWMDMRIILKTIGSVLKRENISSATSATMEEFMGNEDGDGF